MTLTDPNQLVIYSLIFLLGLLVGGFLFSGGGRKWRHRHDAEVARRRELEADYATREREWREKESLHAAALKNRDRSAAAAPVAATADPRDLNNDGIVDERERRGGFMDRLTGRDRDNDGVRDANDGYVDRDGDGVDDRRER
jgi:hypothetical protein